MQACCVKISCNLLSPAYTVKAMKTIRISTAEPYDVIVGNGILGDIGAFVADVFTPRKICILTDSRVNGLYSQVVMSSLMEHGFQTSKIIFPTGEHSKNLNTYANIVEALADEDITKSDLILALGGGVVCDLAGFVAGTYMRGIKYLIVPTTIQAAVDSAVGGKAGINLLSGKNLTGIFWQPSLVVTDYRTFSSLSKEELLDGTSEVIKCAAVADATIVDRLREYDHEYVLDRCLSIKKSLVEADEHDLGIRQLLNFGHTIGHGIEKLSAYSVSHGAAVAKGMIAESRGAYRTGLSSVDISGQLDDILTSFNYDTSFNHSADLIYQLALTDKKIRDGKINMTVPEYFGKCTLKKISLPDLSELIHAGLFHG